MQHFNLIPPLLKIIINNKNNLLVFTKECHLLPKIRINGNINPEGFHVKPEGLNNLVVFVFNSVTLVYLYLTL